MTELSKGFAVVTGASSGIGAAYAERLAKRGYDLILVARREDRLRAVAKKISEESGRKAEIVVADLSDRASLKRVEDLLRNDKRVTMLVNNAGLGAGAPFLASDVDNMSSLLAVNVDALMRLTYAAVPAFVEAKRGTVINISSSVGVTPEILNGVYGGSKAFVLAFSQSLRQELTDKGVTLQVVLPGATATEIWETVGLPLSALPKEWVMSTEDMVDAALVGLDKGEFVTAPSLPDTSEWEAYDAARQAVGKNLSLSVPAARYR